MASGTSMLAELLLTQGAKNVSEADVEAVAEALGLPPDYFALQKEAVYSAFLADLVADANIAVGEISELQQLRKALSLGWPTIGAKHLERGVALARGSPAEALRDSDPAQYARVRKLLFLTDTLLASGPRPVVRPPPRTKPASKLGGLLGALQNRTSVETLVGRTIRAIRRELDPAGARGLPVQWVTVDDLFASLSLSREEGRALCRETALPFYTRALQVAIGRMSNSTGTQLERVRNALQLDLSDTTETHRDAFISIVQRIAASGRLDQDDRDMLSMIGDTLALRERETRPIVEAATQPIYQAAVGLALARALAEPAAQALQLELWSELGTRQQELTLAAETADALLGAEVGARVRPLLEQLTEALEQRDDRRALASGKELLSFANAAARFVWASKPEKVAAADDVAGLARSFLHGGAVQAGAQETVDKLLTAAARMTGALSATDVAQLAELIGVPADAAAAKAAAEATAQLRQVLDAACASGDAAAFEAADSVEASLGLPQPLCAKARLDAFYERLSNAAEDVRLDEDGLETLTALVRSLRLDRMQLQMLNEETENSTEELIARVRKDMLNSPARDNEAIKRVDKMKDILLGRRDLV
ncbi:hypothetical protein T492DRAFT_482971 [Pavlovales sp. CCMP2436]|nr:hypothetical protein T492DRAFT_482971 [Pavlovales sp. CCMP2436]